MAEPEKTIEPVVPASEGVPKDVVDKLVATFESSMAKMAESARPAPPAPVDPAIAREKAVAAQAAALTAYEAKCAAGSYAEAMAEYVGFMQNQAAATPHQDPREQEGFRGMVKQAERLAKMKHEKLFEKYGKEVAEAVDKMDPAKQLNPDAWDEAVGQVRTAHFDEILEEAVEASKVVVPRVSAPGNRPGTSTDDTIATGVADLSADALGVCRSFRVTPEQYAKQKDEIVRLGGNRGAIPMLKDLENGRVKPGAF